MLPALFVLVPFQLTLVQLAMDEISPKLIVKLRTYLLYERNEYDVKVFNNYYIIMTSVFVWREA